jgi:hypothetical protein
MTYRVPLLSVVALAPVAALAWLPLGGCDSTAGTYVAGTLDAGPDAQACVFTTRTAFLCPGQPETATAWQTECKDGVDCATLTTSSQSESNGCDNETDIGAKFTANGTCASLGATNTTGDAAAPLVLDAAAPLPCSPADDAGAFTPTWHPPRVDKGKCTIAQIDSFRQCINDVDTIAAPPSCAPWYSANPKPEDGACLACLVSKPGDAAWGPFVGLPTQTLINVPGCLAIAEGAPSGTGCGGALSASQECGRAACAQSCPVGASDPTTAQLERSYEELCEKAAETGACLAYTGPAQCAGKIVIGDAGNADEAKCLGVGSPGSTRDAIFEAVAAAFCGPQ